MYRNSPIMSRVEDLASQIARANALTRLELQPKLDRLLSEMKKSGTAIPAGIRNLHEQLIDEVFEDRFDNLPI
ncbi:MAG: hypothetical protein ABJL99_03215 [Aliishimia sp.]